MTVELLESRRLFSTLSLTDSSIFTGAITGITGVTPATITVGDLHLPPGATATVTLDKLSSFKGSATLTKAGTLVITGTAADDRLSVVQDGNTIKFPTFVNGETLLVGVKASQIKRILVEAGAGDDKVFIDPAITRPVTVAGGSGNDTLDGNAGCTLIGGAGNDHLYASANSVLNGGDGNDTLAGGSSDSLAGGAGHDLAILLNSGQSFFGAGGDSEGGTVGVIISKDGTVNGQPLFAQSSSIERFIIAPTDVFEVHLSNP